MEIFRMEQYVNQNRTEYKMKKQITTSFFLIFCFFVSSGFAQSGPGTDQKTADMGQVELSQEDKSSPAADKNISLEESFRAFSIRHDYDKFYEQLEQLLKQGGQDKGLIYFYMARAKQEQISYWREIKDWENIYEKDAVYKKEILDDLLKAQDAVGDDNILLLRIKYLKWQVLSGDESELATGAFNDLVNTAKEKVSGLESIEALKSIADDLSSLQDKNFSRRLYDVYLEKLALLKLPSERWKTLVDEFLAQGDAYLAKAALELYFSQLTDHSILAGELVLLADKFAINDAGIGLDPSYAETIYQRAYHLAGISIFSDLSQYRRAFNLERLKEYEQAFQEYKNLLDNFPDYDRKQEIYFRLGVLAAYAKKNIDLAQSYFLKLTQAYPNDPQSLSALYQLGLLNQWRQQVDEAKAFYTNLVALASSMKLDLNKDEIAVLASERLKEIEEKKGMKYPLKIFLSGVFVIGQTEEPGSLNVDVTAQPPNENANVPVDFLVTTSVLETGCMVPAYSYEWSGELGSLINIPNSADLKTEYASSGIKFVQVAVVGPQGVEGVGFEMVKIIIENNKSI